MEGYQPWASVRGTFSLPLEAFIEELHSFNKRLFKAIEERIHSIDHLGKHTGIPINTSLLTHELKANSSALSCALEYTEIPDATPWNEVAAAIQYFEDIGYPMPRKSCLACKTG